MTRTRDYRRHHRARMRAKAARLVLEVWHSSPEVAQTMIKNADNLKICGGPCCKNPRRSGWTKAGGKTLKELEPLSENHGV